MLKYLSPMLMLSILAPCVINGQAQPDISKRLTAIEDMVKENQRKLNLVLAFIRYPHICQIISNDERFTRGGMTLEEARSQTLNVCQKESKSTKDSERCERNLMCEKGLR